MSVLMYQRTNPFIKNVLFPVDSSLIKVLFCFLNRTSKVSRFPLTIIFVSCAIRHPFERIKTKNPNPVQF